MKTLKNFDFPTSGAAKATYDWDLLLDGKVRQLDEGLDYTCKSATLITLARATAKKRGLTLKAAKVEGGVVLQASKVEG
jgi:hypothetical protein